MKGRSCKTTRCYNSESVAADQACSAQGQRGAAATAALPFQDASSFRDAVPPLGASPVASQAHLLAAAADTASDTAAVAAAAGGDAAAAAAGDAAAAAAGDTAAAAGDTAAAAAVLGSSTWHDGDGEPGSGVVEAGGAAPEAQLSLEWLRSAPPDVATAFLMSVGGETGVAPKLQLLLLRSLQCLYTCLLHACMHPLLPSLQGLVEFAGHARMFARCPNSTFRCWYVCYAQAIIITHS